MKKTLMCATAAAALAGTGLVAQAEDGWYGRADIGFVMDGRLDHDAESNVIFKILLVAFAGLVFIHAIAFFYRSYLEFVEGEGSENKYLDKDSLGEGEEAYEGAH